MKKNFLAVWTSQVLAAAMVIVCGFVVASCNDKNNVDEGLKKSTSYQAKPQEDPDRVANYDFGLSCDPKDDGFVHTGTSTISIYQKDAEEPEKVMEKSLRSTCGIDRTPDTVRVAENWTAVQTSVSIARSYKANVENDNVTITVSDGRVLTLPYEAQHASEKYMNVTYVHGHDSLMSARLVSVEQAEIPAGAGAPVGQYIKKAYNTTYGVEVTTGAYDGANKKVAEHKDVLKTTAVTLVLADNSSTKTITETGEKVINEEQQQDSVVVTTTWPDGHSERMTFNTILNRSLKNIERREVFVSSFANQSAGNSFSRVEGGESVVRSDANWTIYGRETVISKMVSVDGRTEEVRYTLYQERAEFKYENLAHSFAYVNWQTANYGDNFKAAAVSTKADYDELDYTNEIRTSYLGYIQMSSEAIAWFKEAVKISGYGVINAVRTDYPTYTFVTLDKIAYYSDGSEKKVGTYSAKLPIEVKPLTNWIINTNVWGVYTSNDFSGAQQSRNKKTAEKFFVYNQYAYVYSNEVSTEQNRLSVSVPNDIVFNDGQVEYAFSNSELAVSKKNEDVVMTSNTSSLSKYAYTCVADVKFGEAAQDVTLPGTINLNLREHTHGKVIATYMTTTPNEDRSFYKSVAVIAFEDGYRMVGMTTNSGTSFDFTMESNVVSVNSAVYTGGKWMPSIAENNTAKKCMIWKDEAGTAKRTLDFITATAEYWNNGHNTIWDVRREGRISADGYTVEFYLNGLFGQRMEF